MKFRDKPIAITALIAFSFWLFVVLPLYYSTNDNQKSDQCATEEYKNHGFWEKTGCDPVAFFTAWLVGFTGVLGASTIGLWWVTWRGSVRQSRDMEDSIKAARDSNILTREIFTAEQRPWLQWALSSVTTLKKNGPRLSISIDGTLKNIGRVPAMDISYFGLLYSPKHDQPAVNFGQLYFDQHFAESTGTNFFSLAAILPQETLPMRFGPQGVEIDSLPDNFTLWLSFHAYYRYSIGSNRRHQMLGQIGGIYMVQPIGGNTLIFDKAKVVSAETPVAIVEFAGGRRLT